MLDFGVPQISIEVDGIQVQARLVEDVEDSAPHPSGLHNPPGARPPPFRRRPSSPPPPRDDLNETSDDDQHVPTVDELTKSFLREEPAEEIRELQHELESQPGYLQESVTSSYDGDDEAIVGMGAPLALPTYLRNILNTALDRLSIVVNNIDVEVEDHVSTDSLSASKTSESSPVSLNFRIERIAIDSVNSQNSHIEVSSATAPKDTSSRLGKRRMRVENICARLVSDADNFVSMSRISRPSSPATTRSELLISPVKKSEPSASRIIAQVASEVGTVVQERPENEVSTKEESRSESPPRALTPTAQASVASLHQEVIIPTAPSSPEQPRLMSSVHTIDDDRFADAASEDGLNEHREGDSPAQSQHSLPFRDMGASSILYDDDGLLEYAMQNHMLDSTFDEDLNTQIPTEHVQDWGSDGESPDKASHLSASTGEASTSALPTVSVLGRSFRAPSVRSSPSHSKTSEQLQLSTNLLDDMHQNPVEQQQSPASSIHSLPPSFPEPEQDLSESQLLSHDDAESMYMSAMSVAPTDSARPHLPGNWDSSPTSSRDSASDRSGSIPEEMISGSILAPLPEVDDGCETPRPGGQQSLPSSPQFTRAQTPAADISMVQKQAKVFLTVNEVTLWFPLRLGEEKVSDQTDGSATEESSLDFKPPNIGEDSIFAEMPGSFSNYAHSTSHRRGGSMEDSTQRRPKTKSTKIEKPAERPKKETSPSISLEVGSVVGHIDVSTGRIMFGMLDRVFKALTGESGQDKTVAKTEDKPQTAKNSFELTVQHVGLAWLESITTESILDGQATGRMLDINPMEAILRVGISAIRMTSQSSAQEVRAKLVIGKFVLSSLDLDIVSFENSKSKSRWTDNNTPERLNNDIEVDYEQSKDKRITVVTRPVKVMFDIQKLDDALSSFGGFSGMLELGNSISSNNAMNSPVVSPARPKPRGVHFGDSLPPPAKVPTTPSIIPKIHIHFGEVSLTLKGKSCAVQLQTTSVRVAIRGSNLRLKISEISLSGPYVDAAQPGSPVLVEIRGTTVNLLTAPDETDLSRLISMITPSKDPYENNEDILIETLLRQRRKGSVLRVEVSNVDVRGFDLQQMKTFEALGEEIVRLSKVTKYLPDDDRPGILTLAMVQQLDARISVNEKLGEVSISLQNASVAHVGVPALLATEVGKAIVKRGNEVLIHEVVQLRPQDQLPMIMVRMVGDEMEPVVKTKLFNLCAEYRVSTLMAALGISDDGTVDEIALEIASSVATITGASSYPNTLSRQSSQASEPSAVTTKPLEIDLLLRNCAVGLNPHKVSSKGLFVLTEAHIAGKQVKDNYSVTVELRRASMHAIDDVSRLEEEREPAPLTNMTGENRHLAELREAGFISLSSVSAAKVCVSIAGDGKDQPQIVDVEFKNELLVLESCADSTQTLIAILNGLQPPSPPSTAERYRTVVPLQQMMESFTGDAVAAFEDKDDGDFMNNADLVDDEVPTNLEYVGSFYNPDSVPTDEEMGDSMLGEDDLGALATPPLTRKRGDRGLLESFQEQYEVTKDEEGFDFNEKYFNDSDSDHKGKAKKWDSAKNQYHLTNEFKTPDAPLKVRVRGMNIIWNLYDGYDWPRTRDIITQAVDDVEARAEERRRKAQDQDEDDDDFVEEDFLFNSVWIGVPVKDEKGALARRINHDIDDLASETGSYATSTATRSTGATARPRSSTKSRRRLKLDRSKHKKIAFSLLGVDVDLIMFPPGSGETLNSINVRIRDFEIFDHVPTSTWRKFVTCVIEPSARELDRPMVNLELLTVKPVTDLAASELVIKAS